MSDLGQGLVGDELGFIFLTGFFEDSVSFDPGAAAANLISQGDRDGFFMKVDPLGNLIWVKGLGGIGNDYSDAISLGSEGSIFIAGTFFESIDLDPGPNLNLLTSAGQGDVFFAKYHSDGEFAFGERIGGVNSDLLGQGLIDQEGKIILAGVSYGGIDFDPGPAIVNLPLTAPAGTFLARYESTGMFDYAFYLSDQEVLSFNGMEEDRFGNICLTGSFQNTIDLDPSSDTALLTAIDRDVFVVKYDLKGSFRWAYGIRGDGRDRAGGIDVSPSGEIILTGATEERTDFNIGPGTDTIPWNGYLGAFVARYDQCIAVYPDSQAICPDQSYTFGNQSLTTAGNYVETVSLSSGCDSIVTLNLSIIPVDTGITLQGTALVSSAASASYQWIDCGSNQAIAGSTSPTFSPTYPGDFAVVVTENGCSDTSACLAVTTVNRLDPTDPGLIRLFPNPVQDVLHLEFPAPVKLSGIRVFDLAGRLLLSDSVQGARANYSISMQDLLPGMYLVALDYMDGRTGMARVLVE